MVKNILITGGAGFIGSHVVRRLVKNYPNDKIINGDALTYAGNLENLRDVEGASNYIFERLNITDSEAVRSIFKKHNIQTNSLIFLFLKY